MNYQQEYITDEYIELKMPAGVDDASGELDFQLDQNHLHIWPRHSFMLIALPNKASSFRLFLSFLFFMGAQLLFFFFHAFINILITGQNIYLHFICAICRT